LNTELSLMETKKMKKQAQAEREKEKESCGKAS
jgi:hypothetical protein